jgi:hypothetical protein
MCAIASQADQLKTHSQSFGPILKHRAGQNWFPIPARKKNLIYEIFTYDPAKTSQRNVIVHRFYIIFLAGMLSNAWAISTSCKQYLTRAVLIGALFYTTAARISHSALTWETVPGAFNDYFINCFSIAVLLLRSLHTHLLNFLPQRLSHWCLRVKNLTPRLEKNAYKWCDFLVSTCVALINANYY